MSEKQKYTFNLIYLFVIIVWPVFRVSYINLDGAGRIEILFTVLTVLINWKAFFQLPKVMYIWALWVIYCIICIHFKGYSNIDYPYMLWMPHKLIMPFVGMVVVYKGYLYKKMSFLYILFIFLLLYAIIGLSNLSMNTGGVDVRYENALGNQYLNNLIILFPIAALSYSRKLISKMVFLFVVVMLLFAIVLSGERKSLAGLIIMIAGYFIAIKSSYGIKAIGTIVVLSIVAYFSVSYIFENTIAGSRFIEGMENSEYQNSIFLKLVGDRALMYVEGFEVFLRNMWTGVGLTNFIQYSVLARHVLHSEYMVQMAECGIIGSSLFLFFWSCIIFYLVKMIPCRKIRFDSIVLFASFVAIISVAFTAWVYDSLLFFIYYGFLFAYYNNNKYLIKHSNKR